MNPWNLSDREFEVLREAASGAGSSKEIARTMVISDRTVEHHFSRAVEKMKAANRLHAVLLFDRVYRTKVTAIKPAHGVQDCAHCAGLGFTQRSAA